MNYVMTIGDFEIFDDYVRYNGGVVDTLVFPKGVTEIRDYWCSFVSYDKIKHVILPSTLKILGYEAFKMFESMESISGIPEGVTSIGWDAFDGCKSLTHIELPDSITNIGESAFYGCESLTHIELPKIDKLSKRVFSGCKSLTSITIPNSVREIGIGAFLNCESLTSIIIPNSVTNIGDYAFGKCSSLLSIYIPNSVTEIGIQIFDKNPNNSLTVYTTNSLAIKYMKKYYPNIKFGLMVDEHNKIIR